ncbi:MAG: cation diffusion facilitator family transporter [Candidatus Magnetoovum sp. WYHC-5]|nr:cation diffusion facilitator family transporter [Candidatus Magnetoovum sp. WYHC-5]
MFGSKKERAAFFSIISNTTLIVIKIIVGMVTASVSIVSEAIHSGIDLLASAIAYASVKKASVPADKEHNFGHGKYENVSALVEAILIILASLYIIYMAVVKFSTMEPVSYPLVAVVVMGISAISNYCIAKYLYKVAKETDSIALEADAKHLSVDVYTSVGVFVSLLIVSLTGWRVLDSICAMVVAGLIFYEGYLMTNKALKDLLDTALPDEEVRIIKSVLKGKNGLIKDYHDLRTRKSGSERHIDLHLTVCKNEPMYKIHDTMDTIEKELQDTIGDCTVMIRPEPCEHSTNNKCCPKECSMDNNKKAVQDE